MIVKQELSEANMALRNRGKPRRNIRSSRSITKAAAESGAMSMFANGTQPGLVRALIRLFQKKK
jgi:hypothetical protein